MAAKTEFNWLDYRRKQATNYAHQMQLCKDRGQDIETGEWLSTKERERYESLERILERTDCEIEHLEECEKTIL